MEADQTEAGKNTRALRTAILHNKIVTRRGPRRSRTRARSDIFQWSWSIKWKGRADYELTEAQKLAEQLVAQVDRKNTTQQAFKVKMDALRKARAEEAELKAFELSKVRQELRELLTTREEAALVLMRGWL